MKKKSVIASLVSAIISAVLLFAAFPPMSEAVDVLFALVPLLVISRLGGVKRSAWAWGAAGLLFWTGTLSWLVAISKNGGPLPLVVLGLVALAGICGGYFALFGALDAILWKRVAAIESSRLRRIVRIAALFLAEPVLWAGLEWVRGWFLTGFAWNYLGTAVSQFPDFALAARFGGVYLVSAMVLSVNGVFATLIERVIARMMLREEDDNNLSRCFIRVTRNLETLLPLLGVVAFVYLGSRDAQINEPEKKLSLKASLIQRNAPSVFKSGDTRENPYEVFGTLLTTCRYSKPDLVVWAESAMSEFGHLKHPRAYEAAKFVAENTGGAALLSGGDYIVFKENERLYYNGAAIYHSGPKGVEVIHVDIYAKRHLVPFGEYIPFDKWIKPLQKLSPIGVSLYPGNGTVLKLYVKRSDEKGVTNKVEVVLGPLICFEDTDSPLARDSARHGAQLLVLITNDSWFSHSAEAEQHAWQSVMRSIETGLPMIRVGNSGVTGSVSSKGVSNWLCDGNGKVLVDAKGSHTVIVDVPQNPKKTLYVRLGDFPLAALFFTVLSFIFFPLVKSRIIAKER